VLDAGHMGAASVAGLGGERLRWCHAALVDDELAELESDF
jgi:hypothetical protein